MERRTFMKGVVAGSGLLIASSVSLSGIVRADDDMVRHLENRANPSTLEKKHVPAIEAPASVTKGEWFTVKIKVGFLIEHPSAENHWIKDIKLLLDKREVADTEFEVGGVVAPYAEYRIRLEHDAVLTARAECNLHGEWESEPLKIRVV